MKALDLWNEITGHFYELRRDGDSITLEATDFSRELPASLVSELKSHKAEMLALLRFQEEADTLLLESSGRIAPAWPPGCDLDTDPRWRLMENDLHEAYFVQNFGKLKAVLELRERLALKLFEAHRKRE